MVQGHFVLVQDGMFLPDTEAEASRRDSYGSNPPASCKSRRARGSRYKRGAKGAT